MKFYDAIIISVFLPIIFISLQESVLEELESTLGNHMIIEHMLFFVMGALSVSIAGIILRTISRKERGKLHIEEAEKENKMLEGVASTSQAETTRTRTRT